MLNSASPLPLYQQLAERLASSVELGRYPVGERIPSEHDLAARYGIGRPTVRQATELLVRRGVLERRRGAGTFVVGPPAEVDVFSMAGTLASFRDRGIGVETSLLSPLERSEVPASAENPFAGRRPYCFARLSATTQGPVLLEETYLDPELFFGLEGVDLTGRSLASLVRERYRLQPISGRQQFRVAFADSFQAGALDLAVGAPLLQVRRSLHFPSGKNGIFAELHCRSDRMVLAEELTALGSCR